MSNMPSFGTLLKEILDRKQVKPADLSRISGRSNSWISMVIDGQRAPSRADSETLANALDLYGHERDEFLSSSAAAKAKRQQRAVPRIEELERQLAKVREEKSALIADLTRSQADLTRARTDLAANHTFFADLISEIKRQGVSLPDSLRVPMSGGNNG